MPITREQAIQQAQAEGITLRKADTGSGYANVSVLSGRPNPYHAKVHRGSIEVHLGSFATAEEAALCVARSPEGQAAAERAAAAPPRAPLTREQALQQAQAEGLSLRKADNPSGYVGVAVLSGRPKPFQVEVIRGGKQVYLGCFATAEEAALCIARSPEGQAAAERAATAPPTASSEQGKSKAAPVKPPVKEEGSVPPMPLDAVVKEEDTVPPMPSEARWSDAIVKEEHAIVKEEHGVADNGEQMKKKLKNQ